MSVVFRVTHQTIGRSAAAELALPGTGHNASQNFLGNITAVHIVQDVLERGNVHFLPGQTVHTVRDGDIPDMVLRKENLDITASFDIVAAKTGKVFLCQVGTQKNIENLKAVHRWTTTRERLAIFSMLFCRYLCAASYTPLQTPPSLE